MPAKSQAQKNIMEAALHGSAIPMAKKIRQSMTPAQMQDFTVLAPKAKRNPIANLKHFAHPPGKK